ncbi:MAG: glycosyltransferase family 4 protein [Chloroflexaceae bacterium]|nr:glycosyltransferase family 4 protein [Chloroflexaceae bacterium]
MRILYITSGIPVPGTLGGSTHAREVAHGLARRGHTVHLVASRHEGWGGLAPFVRPVSQRFDGFYLHHQDIPKSVALLGAGIILRLARAIRPDVIMERYYNFAGGGVWAAQRLGIPALLEVNALMIDPPEVFKRRLDDALGGPMQRWAVQQCHQASKIVTPLHTTVPPQVPRSKIVELPWGANVEHFLPPAPVDPPLVVFLGSFRNWHGVLDVVRVGSMLLAEGRRVRFRLIGDGPQRAEAQQLAAVWGSAFEFTGAIPYEQVPAALSVASVGVAPFTTAPHPALRAAGFFWSPLKVYEYMAASLPVVTTDIYPLHTIIREGQEGALFAEGDINALAAALRRVLDDRIAARHMGMRARARVVEQYSWQRHCYELENIMQHV